MVADNSPTVKQISISKNCGFGLTGAPVIKLISMPIVLVVFNSIASNLK
jgi:hypothetical protein